MNKYYFILSKILRINYKSLKPLTNYSIILSTMLCVVFISITLSITDGFKKNIISKIIHFDGYARLDYQELSPNDLEYLEEYSDLVIKPYYEDQYIIKSNKDSELITLFSSYNIKEKISNMHFYYNDNSNNNNNNVYVGIGLKNKLFLDKNDSLSAVLINTNNKPFNILSIAGYFETGVPLFDNNVVIANIDNLNFHSELPDGYILSKESFNKLNGLLSTNIYTYNDRYYDFLKWLDSYDLPIYILLLFILIVGLINNKFCYSIDIVNRKSDTHILNSIGFSYLEISYLYWYKFFLLNILGILLGTAISLLILNLELNFNFIKIPSDVYFTSSVPISFQLLNFLYAPVAILLQVFYFTVFKYEVK